MKNQAELKAKQVEQQIAEEVLLQANKTAMVAKELAEFKVGAERAFVQVVDKLKLAETAAKQATEAAEAAQVKHDAMYLRAVRKVTARVGSDFPRFAELVTVEVDAELWRTRFDG